MRNNPMITAMAVYDSAGFVLAHYVPELVGRNMRDVETVYGSYINDAFQAVRRGEYAHYSSYSDVLKSNVQIALTPFHVGNSVVTWTVMIAAIEESAWFSRLFRSPK